MAEGERDERAKGDPDARAVSAGTQGDPLGVPPAPAAPSASATPATTHRSTEKRRLPVLQSSGEPPEEDRPAWHWVPLSSFATFLVWLPLSVLTERVVRHFLDAADARGEPIAAAGAFLVGGHGLAFFAGALAAGALVGRLGNKAGRREAAFGGALAGALAWLIAATQGTPGGALVWSLLFGIIASLGALAGFLGASLGLRLRRRSDP